jgi:hypothetical protein
MSSASARHARGGAVGVAAVSGLLLVVYGLALATWVSSSDSSTRFLDLSYGDPPYGFKRTAWAEVIAQPYFNGGAWVLLVSVAVLVGVALSAREPIAMLAALAIAFLAVAWSLTALVALELIDLQLAAYLPTIGYAIVAGALLSPTAFQEGAPVEKIQVSRLSMWLLYTGALVAATAAIAAWYWPVNSFDSSCSLATRNRYDNDGACADFYRTQWILFVGLVLAAIILAVGGVFVARRLPAAGRRGSVSAP